MMRRSLLTLLVAAAVPVSVSHAAAPPRTVTGRFTPVDSCAGLTGAPAFRAALARAVRQRDAAGFAALTTPDVRLDFGDGAGRAELRRRLQGADGRKLWRELDSILTLGCAVQGGNLVMPAIFAHDFGEVDAFDVMIVTGAAVPLRAAPNARARVLRLLSWVAVTPVTADDFERPFRQVRLANGPSGYVETARLRSPLDYRIVASRRGRAWKIDAFVAGD
jgi:hypothetical protein